MTAASFPAARALAVRAGPLRSAPATHALAVAALLELALVRVGSRTAIHLPAFPELRRPYEAVVAFGNVALDVAQALAILALVLVVVDAWRSGTPRGRLVASVAVAFLATASSTRLGWGPPGVWQAATVGIVVALAAGAAGGRGAGVIACFGIAWLALGLHTALQGLGFELHSAGRWLLWVGEAAGVAVPFAAVLSAPPRSRNAWLAAAGVGLLVGGAMAAPSGWTARFLTLWNLGVAGSFPAAVYGAAAAAGTAALIGGYRAAWPVAPLFLAGGLGLHNTYQSALVVTGLARMALPARGGDVQ